MIDREFSQKFLQKLSMTISQSKRKSYELFRSGEFYFCQIFANKKLWHII